MSDAPDNERDSRPVSSGQSSLDSRGPGGQAASGGSQAASGGSQAAGSGSRAAARTREPGRPASRAEPAGRTGSRHRIGIRELRQHASVYVDLAEKGYTVDITNRGRLVAQLVPVTEPGSPLERLIAAGIIEPAEEPGGVGDLEPYPSRGAQR